MLSGFVRSADEDESAPLRRTLAFGLSLSRNRLGNGLHVLGYAATGEMRASHGMAGCRPRRYRRGHVCFDVAKTRRFKTR
jgi:hypothetical protein